MGCDSYPREKPRWIEVSDYIVKELRQKYDLVSELRISREDEVHLVFKDDPSTTLCGRGVDSRYRYIPWTYDVCRRCLNEGYIK